MLFVNRLFVRLLGLVILASGIAMVVGGSLLTGAGGTPYYLVGGVALCFSGLLVLFRRVLGLDLYALFLAGTAGWAWHEVGPQLWPLLPRLDIWALLAVLLVLPPLSRAFVDRGERSRAPLLLTVLATIVIGAIALAGEFDESAVNGRLAGDTVIAHPNDPSAQNLADADWPSYGRTQSGTSHSPLGAITPGNADQLEQAWVYHTGDLPRSDGAGNFAFEATPIKVGDALYLCTPYSKVIALDAASGAERWVYDPRIAQSNDISRLAHTTCRGVSFLDMGSSAARRVDAASNSAAAPSSDKADACSRRLFAPVNDGNLVALDADTGKPCAGFGTNGQIDLTAHIGEHFEGEYLMTSPPVVAHGLVIVNAAVKDNHSTDEPSGVIRAFDAKSGALVWNFDVSQPDATAPIADDAIYPRSTVNSWTIMSADPELGLVYVPMGNETPDLWGGDRSASGEQFSASIVALHIDTGTIAWQYQTVHHDLWDQDMPAQMVLTDMKTDDGVKAVIIAPTKHGDIFVLDRRSGELVVAAPETAAPQGAAPGDHVAATQPSSRLSLRPPPMQARDMWGATPFDQLYCRVRFKTARFDGLFTPPATRGTVANPGNFGVMDWNGIAVDTKRQILFAAPNYMAFYFRLIAKDAAADTQASAQGESGIHPATGTPYKIQIEPLLSPLGLPCQAPPWGYVAGIDLQTQKLVWQHRNGTIRDTAPLPVPIKLGVPSLGGMVTTDSGVAFMAGSLDTYLRAYDVTTGEQLWEGRLPAGGQAKPAVYSVNGRQYVVVAAGGHEGLGTTTGDAVVAFALPESAEPSADNTEQPGS